MSRRTKQKKAHPAARLNVAVMVSHLHTHILDNHNNLGVCVCAHVHVHVYVEMCCIWESVRKLFVCVLVGGWEMCVSVCVCAYFCTAVYHPAASVRLMTTSTGMRSATASLLALMVRRMPFPACVCL